MPSKIGQICRTMAQKVDEMQSPCIQITPTFSSSPEEFARLYYIFSEVVKNMEDQVKDFLVVSIEETGAKKVQCPDSDNNFHEFMEVKEKNIPKSTMMCIHCGAFVIKTTRTDEELKEFFANKQFKRKEVPRELSEEAKEF